MAAKAASSRESLRFFSFDLCKAKSNENLRRGLSARSIFVPGGRAAAALFRAGPVAPAVMRWSAGPSARRRRLIGLQAPRAASLRGLSGGSSAGDKFLGVSGSCNDHDLELCGRSLRPIRVNFRDKGKLASCNILAKAQGRIQALNSSHWACKRRLELVEQPHCWGQRPRASIRSGQHPPLN